MEFKKDPNNPLMTDHTEPALLWIEDTLYCYYRTDSSIGVMESKDGLKWTDHGMVLIPSKHGFDSNQVIAPSAIFDYKIKKVFLYYEGVHTGGSSIGVAHSLSPLGPFTKLSFPTLQATKPWESTIVGTPLITQSPKGKYYLFYHGASLGFMDKIGVAYGETIVGPWRKEKRNPIIRPKLWAWNGIKTAPTSGFWYGIGGNLEDFILFYEGFRGWPWSVHGFNIGMTEILFADNGEFYDTLFAPEKPVLTRGPKGSWDDLTVQRPGVVLSNDGTEILMYYSGANKSSFQLGRATADLMELT
jgi:hypothetical protein